MVHSLVKNWWAVAIVGVLAVALGIYSFAIPGLTLAAMVVAFGAYALATGVVQLVAGISGTRRTFAVPEVAHLPGPDARRPQMVGMEPSSRAWLIVAGIVGVAAGLVTFLYPGLTLVTLYTVIAVWAIVSGIAQMAAALTTVMTRREDASHTGLVALGGLASIILGAWLFARPLAGMAALAFTIGVFAVVYGVTLILGSIQLKRIHDTEVTIGRRVEAEATTPIDRLTPH